MQPNQTLAQRLSDLSPEQKGALERLLRSRAGRGAELRRRRTGQRVPLSYGQQRLWLLDQLSPENPAYNETNSMRFLHALDRDVFARAINEIIRRHESLRMSVEIIDGAPYQRIATSLAVAVPVIDLRHLVPDAREAEALRLAAEQSRIAFDLGEGPLLRACLYRLESNDYLFVLTLHHIVCDGWSMGVFMVELLALYWSFLDGKPSPLADLEIEYGDYAVWQRQNFTQSMQQTHLAYWRELLKDLPELLLPTDRPRPAEFTYQGARYPLLLDAATQAKLSAFAKEHSTTIFTVLLTVFAVLLHRYTEQEDFAVGAPSAGRSCRELERLIGFLVNTLVMRLSVPTNATFLEVLEHVRHTTVEAYANQDLPFDRLVEELQPKRDRSRNPLIQVIFQLFSAPSTAGLRKDLLLPFTPVDWGISKFDLSVELIATDDAIRGHIEYSTDLFDRNRIERMVGHYLRLIAGAIANPHQRISDLPMLSMEEESRVLTEWNQTSSPYPRDSTISQVFLDQVRKTPDLPALRFHGETLSYRELASQSHRIAQELATRGTCRGDVVGLFLDRGLSLPAALLAILQAGAAYVPFDTGSPRERILNILEDSGARCIVTSARLAGELDGFRGDILVVDGISIDSTGDVPPGSVGSADDLAYVMYTSGTTGVPKGVAVTHRNIMRLVKGVSYVDFEGGQTVLQFAPVSFDASTFEIWGCLLNGGTLAIHPPEVPSLEELGAFIRTEGVSLLFLTTSLFGQMVEHCSGDLRGVGQLVTGGETLFPQVAKAAWRALPRSRIVNGYGPTECTTFACAYTIGRPETLGDSVPIGRPIGNAAAYVLDRNGKPMPVGVPGELYIGGDGVSRGYWKRPDLTSERFIPDPFAPGGTLYRTGDVARLREDGNILFLGRRDRQVKMSGYRIELGEVESAILAHPDVCSVAVVLTGSEDKRLSAFVELHQSKSLSRAALSAYLSHRLPRYMVPSHVEIVDRLPLTPNGKVDLEALALRAPRVAGHRDDFVPARNPTEQVLCETWTELLQTNKVGVTDNFFELGGHSLLATRLLSRIRQLFGEEVKMREFFDNPTIESLAELLGRSRAGSQLSARVNGWGSQ